MDRCKLGVAFAALALLFTWGSQPALAGASAAALQTGAALPEGAARLDHPVLLHRHRAQSFYCYPKNYWWFYRPYTTAFDGHARCMPYFHYLPNGRGARARGYVK